MPHSSPSSISSTSTQRLPTVPLRIQIASSAKISMYVVTTPETRFLDHHLQCHPSLRHGLCAYIEREQAKGKAK